MAFVPSYHSARHPRRAIVGREENGRWSLRRSLAVLMAVSIVGWAAVAGIAALVVG